MVECSSNLSCDTRGFAIVTNLNVLGFSVGVLNPDDFETEHSRGQSVGHSTPLHFAKPRPLYLSGQAMEKLFRYFVSRLIKIGSLEIETASGQRFSVGDGSGEKPMIRFNDAAAQTLLVSDPALRFGELFMDGRIDVTRGTIYDVLALASVNAMHLQRSSWMRLLEKIRIVLRFWQQRNNVHRARRNVAHHYDLDSRLYGLFLDSDRQYSCAFFEHQGMNLEDAQLAKKRHIAAKLLIEAGNRVLDIGCGWGGMALYLARFCGAEVSGITLSQEQLAIARARAVESDLATGIDFRLEDYRHVDEPFDRIVSVGMFEHVGLGYYDAYFRKLAELLAENGIALIHTIGRALGPAGTNPWIKKYIFPGGYIPALSEILPAVERAGLILTDLEVLRLHYAETLKAWRERFQARRDEAKALYDERFCRMWEFYLAGAEATFRFEGTVVFQLQLAKNIDAVPVTRDYIAAREAELRRRDSALPSFRIAGE